MLWWRFVVLAVLGTAIESDCAKKDRLLWYEAAREAIDRRVVPGATTSVARNVILFVGDGLGMSTLTAARILRGQRQGRPGEEEELAWDRFPAVALARTYNNDAQVGESSACATALLCGVKANFDTVGLDASGRFNDCMSSVDSRVPSLLTWAQEQGKATGVVTNTRLTHGTPAALYAHSASRYWEDDSKMAASARLSCKDIARQLVEDEPGVYVNVLLGGGRRHWVSKVTPDPQQPHLEGRRLDGRNLIEEWKKSKRRRGLKAEYVWTKEQLDKVDTENIDHLLGMFAYSHMEFAADRDPKENVEPTLAEMTRKAIKVLQKNPRGYFLLVEGGRIDHAHHYNNAYRALDETLQLEDALLAALAEVKDEETLVVVTADHSNVLTLGGTHTDRGNAILGTDTKPSDLDGLPYSTLLYGNGPGFDFTRPRATPPKDARDAIQHAAAPRSWATHGGEDVPVFARGPMASQLFSGSFDQSYIPHAIAYAACLGEHAERCSPSNHIPLSDEAPPDPHRLLCDNIIMSRSVMLQEQLHSGTAARLTLAPLLLALVILQTLVRAQ